MNVGMVGLGKLGLPVAYAMAARGLDVYGYDPFVHGPPEDTSHERDLAAVIEAADDRMRFYPLRVVVDRCDTVLIAVQTPHDPRFEGVTPLPEDRADFDYSYLKRAVADVIAAAEDKPLTIAVISTVLPGTMDREIRPVLPDTVKLVYTPSFIAMGSTIRDFLDPEFVLLGGDDDCAVEDIYRDALTSDTFYYHTTVENAELIKVAYNTFIGLKIAFANTLMEICHKIGCDVDHVTGALKRADRRLISPAYLDGGMGDGGGCHPRDNIALSWLARQLHLSHDLFDDIMRCREDQARWLLDVGGKAQVEEFLPRLQAWRDSGRQGDMPGPRPAAVLGIAYKPGSHITTGSAAMLLAEISAERKYPLALFDPHVDGVADYPEEPHAFIVGCKHPEFADFEFPEGSIVIDPFRYIPDQPGVEVIRLGQWEPARTATSASTNPPLAA